MSAVVLTSALWNLSCDSTALITVVRIGFDQPQVVSATPVKLATVNGTETWVPACSGDATHTRVNFNLQSTSRNDEDDQDRQIRPGDIVNTRLITLGRNLTADNFTLNATCVQEHSGNDNSGDGCTGVNNPPTSVVSGGTPALQFVDNMNGGGRGTSVGVAILVDQSGSINGKVEGVQAVGALEPPCIEGAAASVLFPNSLEDCASDHRNYRLSAAKNMVRSLNPTDRHIVFGFGEEMGVSVACNIPGFNEPWTGLKDKLLSEQDKQNNCYTTDKRYTLGEDGVAAATWPSALTGTGGLQGNSNGRANLWTAIKTSYDFMKGQGQANRHIVIFADGPDTCQPAGDYQYCLKGQAQLPCANSTDFAAAKNAVLDYQTELETIGRNAVSAGVHVSFIHIQARGYKESSAQMQELACLTGGHYIFVNAAKLSYAQSEQRDPIEAAANELRLTLGGHYGLVADVSPLSAPQGTPGASAVGAVHAISGELRFENTVFRDEASVEGFSWGAGKAGESLPGNYDARLLVHRPCTAAADCGGAGAPCTTTCNAESRSCDEPPPGSACGASGDVCCGTGNCAIGAQICNDTGVPLSCP